MTHRQQPWCRISATAKAMVRTFPETNRSRNMPTWGAPVVKYLQYGLARSSPPLAMWQRRSWDACNFSPGWPFILSIESCLCWKEQWW